MSCIARESDLLRKGHRCPQSVLVRVSRELPRCVRGRRSLATSLHHEDRTDTTVPVPQAGLAHGRLPSTSRQGQPTRVAEMSSHHGNWSSKAVEACHSRRGRDRATSQLQLQLAHRTRRACAHEDSAGTDGNFVATSL